MEEKHNFFIFTENDSPNDNKFQNIAKQLKTCFIFDGKRKQINSQNIKMIAL